MYDKPSHLHVFDSSVLGQLACPACVGQLRLANAHLLCSDCHRFYPIVGGIPVLIIERAETMADPD